MLVQVFSGRWAAILVSTLALMLLLAACGSDPEPTAAPADQPTTAATDPTTAPDPTAMPAPEPTSAPEPTAAPTPDPTAMPAPEPTAAPTPEPTAAPQATMSLENFVITQQTTGGDLMGLLSEGEASCVRAGIGDALYQLILGTPVVLMAAGDISQTAPLFNCLAEENVVYLAVAFLDLQAGGWTGESRRCITEVGLGHPDAVYVRLGLDLGTGPIDPPQPSTTISASTNA